MSQQHGTVRVGCPAEEVFDQRAVAGAKRPRTGRTPRPHRAFGSNRTGYLALLVRPRRSPALREVSLKCPGNASRRKALESSGHERVARRPWYDPEPAGYPKTLHAGSASTIWVGDLVGSTRVSRQPAPDRSCRYSASVRSRPLCDHEHLQVDELARSAASPGATTISTRSNLPPGFTPLRQLRRIVVAWSSGQSWMMCFIR